MRSLLTNGPNWFLADDHEFWNNWPHATVTAHHSYGNIGRALHSLSALVDALLDISKLDAGAVKPEMQRIDAGAIAERHRLPPTLGEADVEAEAKAGLQLEVFADHELDERIALGADHHAARGEVGRAAAGDA